MTTEYPTKEAALEMGLFYVGIEDSNQRNELMKTLQPEKKPIGFPQYKFVEVYKLKNRDGKDVEIGLSQFRNGWDLWLIDPETGFAQRV